MQTGKNWWDLGYKWAFYTLHTRWPVSRTSSTAQQGLLLPQSGSTHFHGGFYHFRACGALFLHFLATIPTQISRVPHREQNPPKYAPIHSFLSIQNDEKERKIYLQYATWVSIKFSQFWPSLHVFRSLWNSETYIYKSPKDIFRIVMRIFWVHVKRCLSSSSRFFQKFSMNTQPKCTILVLFGLKYRGA